MIGCIKMKGYKVKKNNMDIYTMSKEKGLNETGVNNNMANNNMKTVVEWLIANGIKYVYIKVDHKLVTRKDGTKKLNKVLGNCSWYNNKYPSSYKTEKKNSFWVFGDEEYKTFLEKKDTITDCNYLAIDTSKIIQVDFDEKLDMETINYFKKFLPYYKSAGKKLPLFILKDSDWLKKNWNVKKFRTKNDPTLQGEILNGLWAWCNRKEFMANDIMNIPKYSIEAGDTLKEFKEQHKPTNITDEVQVNQVMNTIRQVKKDKEYDEKLIPMLKELANIIDVEKYVNSGCHDKYMLLVWSLHNYKDIMWSIVNRGNSEAKIKEFEKDFNSYNPNKGISLNSFYQYAEDSNKSEYLTIMSKYHQPPDIFEIETDFDMAEEIFKQKGDYFVFQDKELYRWDDEKERWFQDNLGKGNATIRFVEITIKNWIIHNKNKYFRSLQSATTEEIKEKRQKQFDECKKQAKAMGVRQYIKNVTDNLIDILAYRKDNVEWDNHPELFAFNNCVYNFITKKFSKQLKDYHLIQNACYDWVEPTQEQSATVKDIVSKIFHGNKEGEISYMSVLRNGLTGWCNEKFCILQSGGRSGKGLLNEKFSLMLNEGEYGYAFKGAVATFCSPLPDGACPAVAMMGGKRFVKICEGKAGQTLCVATIKELTGGGTFCARKCFSNQTTQRLKCMIVFETNEMLKLDDASAEKECVLQRFIDINLKSTFKEIEELPEDIPEKHLFIRNDDYKDVTFQNEHRCAFFKFLTEYKNAENDPDDKLDDTCKRVYTHPKVKERTKKYLAESDYWVQFFDEYIETDCPKNEEITTGRGTKSNLHYTSTKDYDWLPIREIYDKFLSTETYQMMTKKQKSLITKKNLLEYLKNHSIYGKYFVERMKPYNRVVGDDEEFVPRAYIEDKPPGYKEVDDCGNKIPNYEFIKTFNKTGWFKMEWKQTTVNKVMYPCRWKPEEAQGQSDDECGIISDDEI